MWIPSLTQLIIASEEGVTMNRPLGRHEGRSEANIALSITDSVFEGLDLIHVTRRKEQCQGNGGLHKWQGVYKVTR